MHLLQKIAPIFSWLPSYKKEYINGDLFSGLTVGVMLIPQGMAYALIAGLPPVYGLYASIVPQLIYAIFGTSRQLSVGPVAMDSLLVAAGVSLLATEGTDTYIAFAVLLAFFMGIIQLLLGVLRMGFIVNLLSRPVISGFTSAAALIIGLNQLKYLLGIDLIKSNKIHEILLDTFQQIGQTHWVTLIIGITGIIVIKLSKKVNEHIPGALIAVLVGTVAVFFLKLDAQGVHIVETIPEGLPSFRVPDLSLGEWGRLVPLALTISIVAFMESFSVAKAIEAKKKSYKIVPNQELVALGAANLVGSFFQSFPVTGSFSRSAINYQVGGNTPMSSIVSASLVALTLVFLTPLFYYLPKAILASVIMVAVAGLIDFKEVKKLWHSDKVDLFMLIVTFIFTLSLGIVQGIMAGVVLSLGMVLFKSSYPHFAILGQLPNSDSYRNINRFPEAKEIRNALIIRFDAPLFFANSNYFRGIVENEMSKRENLKLVVFCADAINSLDSTAAHMLLELVKDINMNGVFVVFTGVKGPVRDLMVKNQLVDTLGEHLFFDNIPKVIESFNGEILCVDKEIQFQTNINPKHEITH